MAWAACWQVQCWSGSEVSVIWPALGCALLTSDLGEGRVFIINEHDSAPTLELFMNMNLPPEYIEPVLRAVNWAATERRWRSRECSTGVKHRQLLTTRLVDEPLAVDEATTTPAGKPLGERDKQRLRKRRALFEEHERTRHELFDGEFDG